MDGLSAAASVIAVLEISKEVYSSCQKYYFGVKHAREEIQRLSNEVLTLGDILEKVADFVNGPHASKFATLQVLNESDGAFEQCAKQLKDIKDKLQPTDGMRNLGARSLKWPLKSDRVNQAIWALEKYKSAFELALATDHVAVTIHADTGVSELRDAFAAARIKDGETRVSKEEKKLRERTITWLSTTDPSTNHVDQRRKHQATTGDWFVRGRDLEQWQTCLNSFVWLHGTSGCGKTVLSSTIIEYIRDNHLHDEGSALAYYYFDFNDPKKQKALNFLSSITAQLCAQRPALCAKAKDLYVKCQEGRHRPLLRDLLGTLGWIIKDFSNVFIVVDALDECPEKDEQREELLEIIKEIHDWGVPQLRFLATSRREVDIEAVLEPLLTAPAVCIHSTQVNADIKLHVRLELEVISAKKKWPVDLVAEIEEALVNGANGMFRWVFCQLDTLKVCLKPSLVRQKLKSLPKDLEETYARILLNIHEEYFEDAYTALRWLCYAERPLHLEELVEALLIVPGRDPPFNPEDRLSDPHGVLQILPGLVSVSANAETQTEEIRLAHFSVKEYLVGNRIMAGPTGAFGTTEVNAHQFITESCLVYILEYDQALDRSNSAKDLETFPLLEYACRFWYVHKRAFVSDDKTPTSRQANADGLLMQLLLSDSRTMDWLQVHRPDMTWQKPFENNEAVLKYDLGTSLYYAACIGFREAVRRLLDKGVDPNFDGGYYRSPLRAAAHNGQKMTCLLLLHRGARLEDQENDTRTALWYAAEAGQAPAMRYLLQIGANVEAGSETGEGTALYAAASNRHIEAVKVLLENSADVNAETMYKKTAIRGAAMNGDLEMLVLLLDNKANIEARDSDGQTPLIRAAMAGKAEAVTLLIDRGAEIATRDNKDGQTALHWAASYGQFDAVSALLRHGADIETQDDNGQRPLHKAACGGRERVVRLLLEKGADPAAEDKAVMTAGDWAWQGGREGAVRILREAGLRSHSSPIRVGN